MMQITPKVDTSSLHRPLIMKTSFTSVHHFLKYPVAHTHTQADAICLITSLADVLAAT